jgi:hypothetical protein
LGHILKHSPLNILKVLEQIRQELLVIETQVSQLAVHR